MMITLNISKAYILVLQFTQLVWPSFSVWGQTSDIRANYAIKRTTNLNPGLINYMIICMSSPGSFGSWIIPLLLKIFRIFFLRLEKNGTAKIEVISFSMSVRKIYPWRIFSLNALKGSEWKMIPFQRHLPTLNNYCLWPELFTYRVFEQFTASYLALQSVDVLPFTSVEIRQGSSVK